MEIKELKTKEGLSLSPDVYIVKKRAFCYIQEDDIKPAHCLICKEHHGLTAHHIIPKRLKAKNSVLAELRIRICNKCHLEIDGINKYILACKKLAKLLYEVTEGEILKVKEFNEIQEEINKISLLAWEGQATWNNRKLKQQFTNQ